MCPNNYTLNYEDKIAIMHIGDSEIIIDLEDFSKVKNYKWVLCSGRAVRYWYENNKCYTEPLFRLIVDVNKSKTVDYKNNNRLDYRKENLRICTLKERCRHHKLFKNNTTGKSGVCRSKEYRYIVSINIDDNETGEIERLLLPCEDYDFAVSLRKLFEFVYYKEYAPIQ